MRSTRFVVALVLLLLAGAPQDARASAIYEYTGNPFQMALGRYTTSDSLSGSIQVASAFAPNLSNAAITLEAWNFSDGLKFLDAGNSTAESPHVSTDGAGQIVNWSIDFSGGAAVGIMGSFNHGPGDQIDQATDFFEENSLASNDSVPGSWTLVPEPSTGALFALSLSLLAAARAPRHPTSRVSERA